MSADIWFRGWKSKDGQKLADIQIMRLITLTNQWQHNETTDMLSVWASDPSTEFWGFQPSHSESAWVRECLQVKLPALGYYKMTEDYKRISARRRVLLIILYDIIEREILRLQACFSAQPNKFLTTAIRNILEQAYPGYNNKLLYDQCIRCHRYGQNFERPMIGNIEMEALVAFSKATYDKSYQEQLQKTFECILNTCPLEQKSTYDIWLPSISTRKRYRNKAKRIQDTLNPASTQT
ncbi:hypothetical protein P170DRAFT_324840, partial [Aspergillus steynii IBT 23096]